MSYIKISETKKIAEEYGLTVKEVVQASRDAYASITFCDGKNDFRFDKGCSGEWLSREFSKDASWGYMSSGKTGGANVNLDYEQLLGSRDPHRTFNSVEAMASEIVYQYDLGIPVSDIEVTSEGGGDHYYRVINFHALGADRTEYLDTDGDICSRDDSDLYGDSSLHHRDVANIRQQLIDWLEANPQSDLTDEAVPRLTA